MPKLFSKSINLNVWVVAAAVVVIGVVGVGLGAKNPDWVRLGRASSAQPDFESLSSLYSSLQDKFDGSVNPEQILQGARSGLVAATGDPYTTYLTAKEAKALNESLSGKLSGIGIEIGLKNSKLSVIAPIADSPAAKAGLKAGDVIAGIDGQDTSGMPLDEAVSKIRGDKGTQVKLVIIRGSNPPETKTITRDVISVPSVKSSVKPGNIGYIQITQFDNDTGADVDKVITTFKSAGVNKIVLDLRNDPGGYLDQAVIVASQFLPKDQLVVEERRGKRVIESLKSTGGNMNDAKVVVLINGGSASASEILAGALRDNKRAQLIGTTTFGKGSVQEVIKLDGGNELKVTVAHWYTPSGVNISKTGIKPDQKVELTTADSDAGRDPQLDAALNTLK